MLFFASVLPYKRITAFSIQNQKDNHSAVEGKIIKEKSVIRIFGIYLNALH